VLWFEVSIELDDVLRELVEMLGLLSKGAGHWLKAVDKRRVPYVEMLPFQQF
jgi:hypothetical protein